MLGAGQKMPVDRDELLDICSELIDCRQLLARLGSDLRTVVVKANAAG